MNKGYEYVKYSKVDKLLISANVTYILQMQLLMHLDTPNVEN